MILWKIEKWDIILVRGKRPVAVQNYSSTISDISFFKPYITKGDFFRVEIKTKDRYGKIIVLYKVIQINN
jgi:hypothetical protein